MLFSQDESEEPAAQPSFYDHQNPPLPPTALDLFTAQTRTVLVVDQNPIIRDSIQKILQEEHLQSIFANDTSSALIIIASHHPHLILLSIQLASADQYLLCRIIRKKPHLARLPVIIFGEQKDSPISSMRGRLAGSTDFLIQPHDPHQLVQMVKKYLPA